MVYLETHGSGGSILSKTTLKLVDRIVTQAISYERLKIRHDKLTDERDTLHNQNITLRSNLENAVKAVANHAKGIQRLKDKNDKLNADIKTAAGLLRTIHTAGVLNNEDTKAVEEVLERLGYPIQLSIDVEGDIE